jgi:hypothetical protein
MEYLIPQRGYRETVKALFEEVSSGINWFALIYYRGGV